METKRSVRGKVVEWVRRYLPNELAGWVGELGGATVTYWLTGSYAAAVAVATVGASVGYYATAYVNGVRWSYQAQPQRKWPIRLLRANAPTVRSIAVEFGPAEAIDSIIIRPAALYAGPFVLGSTAVGWVVGSIVADVAFYVMAIFSYERFNALLAVRRPKCKEVTGAYVAALATA
ncbi:hypothetical protein CQY20_08190 [Mycolicibacterium agri]|uniref:Uncharacterized protein n=1 Tax=Mycolicibacterium agri TaxID=36811 RepID=A0A2A7N8J1_MYCAG|nr:hypothetical protein [Mycolicibacterium agri]PEG40214.1 hypothetical protein CQY20_08190 [Mycolicibacterium agri]GFG55733.1 hypothetical protein MAGR_71740 [Mycolicibacterium agri]